MVTGLGAVALGGGPIALGNHPRRERGSDPGDQKEAGDDSGGESLVALDEKRELLPRTGVLRRGGKTTLISGKVGLEVGHALVTLVPVEGERL